MPITLEEITGTPKKKARITLEEVMAPASPDFAPPGVPEGVSAAEDGEIPLLPDFLRPARLSAPEIRPAEAATTKAVPFEVPKPSIPERLVVTPIRELLEGMQAAGEEVPAGVGPFQLPAIVRGAVRGAVEFPVKAGISFAKTAAGAQPPAQFAKDIAPQVVELARQAVEEGETTPEQVGRALLEAGMLTAPAIPKAFRAVRPRTIARSFEELAKPEIREQLPIREAPAEAGAPFTPKLPPLEVPTPPMIIPQTKKPWQVTKQQFEKEFPTTVRLSESFSMGGDRPDLKVANLYNGKIYKGKPGETHANIIDRTGTPYTRTVTGFVNKEGAFIYQHPEYSHRLLVEEAISKGESISPEVLADYPDLAAKAPQPVVPEVVTKTEKGIFKILTRPESGYGAPVSKTVSGQRIAPGLFVFKDPTGNWKLTHEISGLEIPVGTTKKVAVINTGRSLANRFDFTQPKENLPIAEIRQAIVALSYPKESLGEAAALGKELPPTVKTPLETAGGGLGFAKGGPELIPANKLMENAKIETKNPKTFIIEEGPKKTLFSNFNRLADEFRRISPGLGKVADDAFLRGTAMRAEIVKAQAQVEKTMGGLKAETKIRVRQGIEGKIPEIDLSPLERQRMAEGKTFFEGYRQKFIQNFRQDLLRPFTGPRQRAIMEAAKQPTPEAAAEFVQKSDFKQFGARKPFTEELAQAAAEYKDFENWGMENYFHRLYPGHLRMLVRRGGEVETIGFAKDVRQAQELFNEWGELNKINPEELVELILFEKRAIPSELKDILGKEKFKNWAEAVEGGAKQIRLKTSRGGFFAAIGKLAREGKISRDVAGDAIATAVFPRTAKRKIGALKPRKLEGELLGLAEPDQAMRALAYSAERKFFVDKLRSQAEGELAKIKDPTTRRWLEEQIDAIAGFPSSWDMSFREFVNKLHPEAGDVAMKAINGQAMAQVILRLGGTNLRFPLVNKLQPLQTVYPLVGERVFTQAMLDKTLSYKPGTWQTKAWQESGLANLPTKFEGTDIPFPIRAVRGAGDAARDAATGLIKLSEVDNWKDSYFAVRRAAKKLGYSDAEANAFGILSVRDTQFPRVPEADIPALRPRVVSQTFGQFQSFNLSYLQFLKKLGRGEKVSPAQLTSPTGARVRGAIGFGLAGGVKALTSPITLLATKMGVMTGVAVWLNEQYEKLKKEIGEQAASAIYFGPAGLGFVDLSRSISLQVPFVSPSGEALSSPALSSIKNIVTAPEGKKLEAVARETPILGPIRRAFAPENLFERQLPKLTTEEKIGRAVGFQPARVSGELLPLESAQITDKKVREERKEAVRRYLDAREAGDIEKAKAVRIEAVKNKLWRSSDDFLESVKSEKKQRAMTFEERKAQGLLKQHRVILKRKKD